MSQGLSQIDAGIYDLGTIVIDPAAPPPVGAPIATGTFNPPNGNVGAAYIYATAGLFEGGAVVSYALVGTLPSGLTLNTSTGDISGTPTTEEVSGAVSVTGTNGSGSDTTNTDTITINAASTGSLITRTFDGTLGARSDQGSPGFDGHGSLGTFSNDFVLGAQSASGKLVADPNSGGEGFGAWGGSFNINPTLKIDDELWYRLFVYYPAGFNFFSAGSVLGLKFMRVHVRSSTNENRGYHDVHIHKSGDINALYLSSEVNDSTGADIDDNYTQEELRGEFISGGSDAGLVDVVDGQWHCFEQYYRFNHLPGEGLRRVWHNGLFLFEDNLTGTLKASTDNCNLLYHHTYWNGGMPSLQNAYISNVKIQKNGVPGDTDAGGRPYIGTEGLV